MTDEFMRTAPGVLLEVLAERVRQDAKWGEQNHPTWNPSQDHQTFKGPDNWHREEYEHEADAWKLVNAERAKSGETAYDGILLEEVFEALAELDPDKRRVELIQVAAVAVSMVEAEDRNTAKARRLKDLATRAPVITTTPSELLEPPGPLNQINGEITGTVVQAGDIVGGLQL